MRRKECANEYRISECEGVCCEVDVGKDELVSVEIMKGKNRLNTKSALCKPRDPGWGSMILVGIFVQIGKTHISTGHFLGSSSRASLFEWKVQVLMPF